MPIIIQVTKEQYKDIDKFIDEGGFAWDVEYEIIEKESEKSDEVPEYTVATSDIDKRPDHKRDRYQYVTKS